MRAQIRLERTEEGTLFTVDVALDGHHVAYAIRNEHDRAVSTSAFRVSHHGSQAAAREAYRARVLRAFEDGFTLAANDRAASAPTSTIRLRCAEAHAVEHTA
jgi:hypothetical protein